MAPDLFDTAKVPCIIYKAGGAIRQNDMLNLDRRPEDFQPNRSLFTPFSSRPRERIVQAGYNGKLLQSILRLK